MIGTFFCDLNHKRRWVSILVDKFTLLSEPDESLVRAELNVRLIRL